MTADVVLDSDVVIWHLRGRERVVKRLRLLAATHRLGLSVITRTEVIAGMRDSEREATLGFLDACEVLPVDTPIADRAGEIIRREGRRGRTVHVPDALIGATAVLAGVALHTCNTRHYDYEGGPELITVTPD